MSAKLLELLRRDGVREERNDTLHPHTLALNELRARHGKGCGLGFSPTASHPPAAALR
jgi:hypothetical protein